MIHDVKQSLAETLKTRLESAVLNVHDVETISMARRDTTYNAVMECLRLGNTRTGPWTLSRNIVIDDEVNDILFKASVAFDRLRKSTPQRPL